ncbi:MAG: hypothetical protein RMM10_13520, partial [Anaerolineae bacterium]|uniref:hypothetical protein n=1 Tax=Thermoflexus sp. TaxID=1969742 RepID=UPI0025F6FA79
MGLKPPRSQHSRRRLITLNRTSVGLKLESGDWTLWLRVIPQSNQRGIETYPDAPLDPSRSPPSIEPAW